MFVTSILAKCNSLGYTDLYWRGALPPITPGRPRARALRAAAAPFPPAPTAPPAPSPRCRAPAPTRPQTYAPISTALPAPPNASQACAVAPPAQRVAGSVRAPYLVAPTPTGITIRWRSAAAAPSVVSFGPSPTNLSSTVSADPSGVLDHSVTLTGLSPGTTYFYAAGAAAATSTSAGVRAPAPPAARRGFADARVPARLPPARERGCCCAGGGFPSSFCSTKRSSLLHNSSPQQEQARTRCCFPLLSLRSSALNCRRELLQDGPGGGCLRVHPGVGHG